MKVNLATTIRQHGMHRVSFKFFLSHCHFLLTAILESLASGSVTDGGMLDHTLTFCY